MNLSYQSLDELQLGIMQINIKDTRHVIEIYTTDDAHLIAEEFVQKNKLKLNSLIRIELELLHTQLDTCHIYQSKLKQYISYLRRTVISTSDAETQLLFHQYNYYDLLLNIYQFYSNIENNIQKYRNYFHKKIEKLNKKNEILTDMFHQSLNKCKEYHEKEKLLIFHCYELEEKLNRAIDIISNSCHTREYSQDLTSSSTAHPTTAIPSLPPGGGDYSSTTTTTIPSSSNDILIQSSSNKSSTNPDLSIKIEKLAEETSDIYTMTLDTMRANYEQKLQQYEIQHNTDQQMILMLQNENNQIKLQLEKYQQQQQQQVSSTTPTSSAINSTNNNEKNLSLHEQQNIILREQFKNLQNSYNNLKLSLQQSTSKNELLTLQIHNISKRSSDQEDENKELRNQLNDLIKSIQVHNIHRLEDENRNLNEQVVTLRGEILRLQNEIHEIQEKAIQAVHVVQLLDKENNNNTPTPTPGATLVKKQSRSQSMNLTEQLSDPIHSQNHLKNEIIDGDITVELSIEPDDDHEDGEDHHEHEQEHEQEEGKKENQQIQDIQEIYTEAEVDLMLQQSIINIKLEEKSIASLSPVVEDRLLRNIYNKYALETTGDLTLSR